MTEIQVIINETTEESRGQDERDFKAFHLNNVQAFSTGGFIKLFDELRALAPDGPTPRLADNTFDQAATSYDNFLQNEEMQLGFTDGSRLSILPASNTMFYGGKKSTNLCYVTGDGHINVLVKNVSANAMNPTYLRNVAHTFIGKRDSDIDPMKTGMTDTDIMNKHHLKRKNDIISEAKTFTDGERLTLKDGTKVTIATKDVALLNKMFDEMSVANRKKMVDVMMLDKSGYEEILSFAREAD